MDKKNYILYLNMILKEDEPVEMVKRSIESIKPYCDGAYIAITYANQEPSVKNKLYKLLHQMGVNTYFFKWTKNFADARQFILDKTPKGDNVFMYWQDADDVLKDGNKLPTIMVNMINLQQSAVFLPYWYMVELDKSGKVREILIEHKRERIIRNDGTWKWVGELHETLIEQRQENIIKAGYNDCVVIHLSNNDRTTQALDRNIEILENAVRSQQMKDPRTLVYLGKAYFDRARAKPEKDRKIDFTLALTLFHKYLEGEGAVGTPGYIAPSGWREERATAWAHVAEIAILQGHPEVAVEAYKSAIDEGYEFPKYYVDLAMAYIMIQDYKRAKHWLRVATAIPSPNTTIITFPKELKQRALQVAFEIHIHERELDKAVSDAEQLLEISPGDEFFTKNLETARQLSMFNKACQSYVYLGKYLEGRKESDGLAKLVQSIPAEMQQEKFASEMRHKFLPKKIWAQDEIAILCGPGWEKWSPKSVDTGIGGSEEAVIQLSKELSKLGWKVTVYGYPLEDAGQYDGVEYKQWFDLNPGDSFNILVLWRSIGFVDLKPKAKFTLLWMHDVPSAPEFTEARVNAIDKIAVLSEFHKSLLRMTVKGEIKPIPNNKIFVTSNGIPDLSSFQWAGNPHRIIYMSSPDRGLIYLLKNWSLVTTAVPDAELHVFYGFTVFDGMHKNNPAQQIWKKTIMDGMRQKGIIYHGRVGHADLHKEINKSGVWAYPTNFEEISCISAMKAQALGAVPVVTDYAALTETVKNGIKVDVDIATDKGQKEYVDALIKILKDPNEQTQIRNNMMKWAKDYFLWSHIAPTWDVLFRTHLQNPEEKLQIKEVS